jgi:hypothetical protein
MPHRLGIVFRSTRTKEATMTSCLFTIRLTAHARNGPSALDPHSFLFTTPVRWTPLQLGPAVWRGMLTQLDTKWRFGRRSGFSSA